MPALSEMTQEEREWLCDSVAQLFDEETSDQLLDLIAARLDQLEDRYLPWWGKAVRFIPGVPDPSDMVRDGLDRLFPEAVRDPLLKLIGCPNVD